MNANAQERELLERFLKTTDIRQPVQTAENLMNRFGSLRRILECPGRTLCLTGGLSPAAALLLTSLPELARLRALEAFDGKRALNRLEIAADCAQAAYVGVSRERFMLIELDKTYRVLRRRYLSDGTMRETSLSSRKLMQLLGETEARAVIFCHNHPGGLARFSAADMDSTKQAMELLEILDIAMLDHLLVTRKGVVSLRRSGMFRERQWMATGSQNIPESEWILPAKSEK